MGGGVSIHLHPCSTHIGKPHRGDTYTPFSFICTCNFMYLQVLDHI